ncbi:MAG: DsbA family oxidoreductase [Desertimonas sp.]
MLVEVWSDVVCPWCYIGKRRFEKATRRLAADPSFDEEIEVIYRPYQLDPSAPPGTSMPVPEVYARKFGGAEAAARILRQVTETAAEEGLEFRLDQAQRANTRDAHRLLWWAHETGPSGAQDALKERLLRAYFTDGDNIGDPDVLVRCATEVGLDAGAARAALDDGTGAAELAESLGFAAEQGITAVPTYVIDGRWSVPGAQDADTFVQVITRLAARDGD